MSQLPFATFQSVVKHTPLISIDLIVKNKAGQVLLGKRTNKPAQDYWFVPGGRILKDETIQEAFSRLVLVELGVKLAIEDASFLGVFEHFYDDNFSGNDFSTHYVVLGYELKLDLPIEALPDEQHNDYKWLSIADLLASDSVHKHSKWYVQ